MISPRFCLLCIAIFWFKFKFPCFDIIFVTISCRFFFWICFFCVYLFIHFVLQFILDISLLATSLYIPCQPVDWHFLTFRSLYLSIYTFSLSIQSLSSPASFLLLLSSTVAALWFCFVFSSCWLLSSYIICFVFLY